MADRETVIMNESYELRTSKTGKTRCTVVVRSEPLVYSFDDKAIARGPAQAVAIELQQKVREIQQAAAASTLKWREKAAKALAAGKPWARKRYAGGRIGDMPPNVSTALFNDSGRFAKSIVATWSEEDGAWRVNVAANRLDGSTAPVETFWSRLTALVPELGNPEALLGSFNVRRAIDVAQEKLLEKRQETGGELAVELLKSIVEAGRAVDETIEEMSETG